MALRLNPETLARASSRHPWRAIVSWLLIVGLMGGVSTRLLSGVLTNDIRFTSEPESVRAFELIGRELTGEQRVVELVIVRSDGLPVGDPAFATYVDELRDGLERLGGDVLAGPVTTLYDVREQLALLLTPDEDGILVPLELRDPGAAAEGRLRGVLDANPRPGFRVRLVDPAELLGSLLREASKGARELSRGIREAVAGGTALTVGLRGARRGTGELAEGLGSLRGGASRLLGAVVALADGAGSLAGGLGAASAGGDQLVAGANELEAGGRELVAGLAALRGASGSLASSSRDLADGAAAVADGIRLTLAGVAEAGLAATGLTADAGALEVTLNDLAVAHPEIASDPIFLEALARAAGLRQGLSTLSAGLVATATEGEELVVGADGVAGGSAALVAGLEGLAAGLRSSAEGARQLTRGTSSLGRGARELAGALEDAQGGASELATGTDRTALGAAGVEGGALDAEDGARDLTGGLGDLFGGASELRSGLRRLSGGSGRLASGLAEGRAQLPDEPSSELFLAVRSPTYPVDDPAFERYASDLVGAIAASGNGLLARAPVSYFDVREQAASLVSDDGRATIVPVAMRDVEIATVDALRRVLDERRRPGFEALLVGEASTSADLTEIAEDDLRRSEGLGIAVALIVLIAVFAAVLAAVLPIVMGVFAIAVALGSVSLIGQFVDFSVFTTNMVSAIGLAVGIDYSLFVVSRYREERRRGFDRLEAIGRTGATANRAVFFSGMTVVLALVGMFVIPVTLFRSMAAGAILVVLASLGASMTLLPALLGLLGDRVNWPRLAKRARVEEGAVTGGFWDRAARGVMRRPVVSVVASVVVLGGLATAYATVQKGTVGPAGFPDEAPSRRAFEVLRRDFAGGRADPVEILVRAEVGSPEVRAAVDRLRGEIAADPAFGERTTVQLAADGNAEVVRAYLAGDPQSEEAFEAVRRLRGDLIPQVFDRTDAEVLVTGNPAFFTDFLDLTDRYEPLVLAMVLALSFVLLLVVFRSVIVPLKAILMNLLSVGAAYGAIVLVFQHGVGIDLFNAVGFSFRRTEAIEAWLPLFLFSVLFGLSMDYHVFLLSRIREEYDRTGDNAESVAHGVRTTAGIITGAALIMVAVFTAVALGRLTTLAQMGFGLAVAVFMDATIVRTVLVPSTMKLLGDANWYLPRWLSWLPAVQVEGRQEVVRVPEAQDPRLTQPPRR